MNLALSCVRSKEITGIHIKPCIPHSNDSSATTENVTREREE